MHKWLTGALTVEQVHVAIADLPPQHHGLRLVQLSDFHFDGLGLSPALLADAIAQANALQPDFVILTGDFVTDTPTPIHTLAPQLATLRSRYGTYAVLGNHDLRYRHSRQEVTTALRAHDITVLWNEAVYPLGPGLAIVGLADLWSTEFWPDTVLPAIPPHIPRLLLSHNPDSADRLRQWRVDLQLSGHTHGGQVNLPGLGNIAPHLATLYDRLPRSLQRSARFLRNCSKNMQHWEWSQGLHQVGSNQLYVNRGLGTYLPGRFRCPPELTLITLVSPS